jgi:hypothetical protein
MTIPFLSDCAGFYLFGGDQATSVVNLAGPGNPLIPVGAPTYASNYAQVDYSAGPQGFRTTDSFPEQGTTAITMMTWPRNAANTSYAALQIMPLSMAGGLKRLLWISATQHQFRTGDGTGIIEALGNDLRPTFYPDNIQGVRVTGPHRYALMAMVDTGTEARMWLQDWHQIKQFTGTPAAATASSPVHFAGQGFAGNAVARIACGAVYNGSLDYAQISEIWRYMKSQLAARGITV